MKKAGNVHVWEIEGLLEELVESYIEHHGEEALLRGCSTTNELLVIKKYTEFSPEI